MPRLMPQSGQQLGGQIRLIHVGATIHHAVTEHKQSMCRLGARMQYGLLAAHVGRVHDHPMTEPAVLARDQDVFDRLIRLVQRRIAKSKGPSQQHFDGECGNEDGDADPSPSMRPRLGAWLRIMMVKAHGVEAH